MKTLVLGGGGREHTLVWKLHQEGIKDIYCIPGNGGISQLAHCVDIPISDTKAIVEFAKSNNMGMTIVGPEAPLANGIVDAFCEAKLTIFGPTRHAAQLESSKAYTKEFLKKYDIPTAAFEIFDDPSLARKYLHSVRFPVVVKASGLAAGKGVCICETRKRAEEAIEIIMEDKKFGDAGNTVVIEEFLDGEEASFLVITDGNSIVELPESQDHKAIYDGDRGPNTGGMGAYSPAPIITDKVKKQILNRIIHPTVEGLNREGIRYVGVLYAGLMIVRGEPFLLEYNVRFGDPETQAILPRIDASLMDMADRAISGNLDGLRFDSTPRACVCVIIASGGYPEKYEKGKQIGGLADVEAIDDVLVFHAGTVKRNNTYFTSGGRVLGVTGCATTIKEAIGLAYDGCKKVHFEGMYYRHDIGQKALRGMSTH